MFAKSAVGRFGMSQAAGAMCNIWKMNAVIWLGDAGAMVCHECSSMSNENELRWRTRQFTSSSGSCKARELWEPPDQVTNDAH